MEGRYHIKPDQYVFFISYLLFRHPRLNYKDIIQIIATIAIGIIRFPLESLCLTITELFHRKFTAVRMSFDVIFLAVTIALTLWVRTPLQIREGTVISVLLLSPLSGI